jgi:MoaA/NifB/PqqE/SkfB family radical SAM enzyme
MNYKKFIKRDAINLDTTHRCSLLCPNCARQWDYVNEGKKVPGVDVPIDSFNKLIKYFNHINFEGQYSDPVHHPKFLEILKMCYDKEISVAVQHASAAKSEKWYIEAFKTNPRALWRFSIDGLPKDSHKYRINQDGEKLFRVMKEATKILYKKPMWQYIVFNYNENDIDTCKQMARDIGVDFYVMKSGRWQNDENDPLLPSKKWRAGN